MSAPASSRGRAPIRVRLLVLPALVTMAFVAAACGSGSPSASSQAGSLISQGIQEESSGKTQQAVHDFNAAAAADPSDATPYYELGVLYQEKLHDSAQAATAYKKALAIKPKYWSAMFNLAIVDTPSQPTAAINLYNFIVLNNPRDANAFFNLGLLLIDQLQPTPGHQALKKAIELNPALAQRVPAGITP